jgi:hypothetical protein
MEPDRPLQLGPQPVSFASFADALEAEIVHLRALTWTATGQEELTEHIVAGFLLRILEKEIPCPTELHTVTVETLYRAYLADVLKTDMVTVAVGDGVTVLMSLDQISEALK